jgi:hypothetical protein
MENESACLIHPKRDSGAIDKENPCRIFFGRSRMEGV